MTPLLMVLAGGTGGHIYPGLAIADEARRQGWRVAWLGSAGGMEQRLLADSDIPLELIQVQGLRGKGWLQRLLYPLQIVRALAQALVCINRHKPDVILGMGGFVSAPGGIAAWLLRRPLIIHEQNAVAGYSNRILAHFSKGIAQAFPSVFSPRQSPVLVGNPVRRTLLEITPPAQRFSSRSGAMRLLVVGGSRGAAILNQDVPRILQQVGTAWKILHQTGRGHEHGVIENYRTLNDQHTVKIVEFIDDMATAMAWADLVICRSGASTVAELMAVGLGALLIPYPFAVDDHQTVNAQYLVSTGGARLISQDRIDYTEIAQWLESINREKATAMACQAQDDLPRHAARAVVEMCQKFVPWAATVNSAESANDRSNRVSK